MTSKAHRDSPMPFSFLKFEFELKLWTMIRTVFLLTFILLNFPIEGVESPSKKTLDPQKELAASIKEFESRWKSLKTYQCEFTQTTHSNALGEVSSQKGKISVKRPDKLRWQYQSGEFLILNGKELKHIRPKFQRGRTVVEIYPDSSKYLQSVFLDFLSGNLEILKTFEPRLLDKTPKYLKIQLKTKSTPSETYIAEIDRIRYVLLALSTEDELERQSLTCDKILQNVDLDEDAKLFNYHETKEDIVHRNS